MAEQHQDHEWNQVQPVIPRPDPVRPSSEVEHLKVEVVKLRDYFEMRITGVDEKSVMRVEALAKELSIALRANAIAIDKAEASVEKRLVSMNEFRATLSDQTATFATRNSIEALKVSLDERSQAIQNTMSAEIKALRAELLAEVGSIRNASQIETKAMWKIIYGLATAVAVIQAIMRFTP